MKREPTVKLEQQGADDREVIVVRSLKELALPALLRLIARRIRVGQCVDIAGQLYQRIDARRYHQRWGAPLRQLSLFERASDGN